VNANSVEWSVWAGTAIDTSKEDQCQDKMKVWRCIFPERVDCQKAMKEAYVPCSQSVIPDLPEYIESAESKATATKVVVDCMTTELNKKYVLNMSHEKLDEYSICTGAVARSKPLNTSVQKALEYSKTLTAGHCGNGTFFRKCYGLSEQACKDAKEKESTACAMKMEAEGGLKSDEASIQEAGRKLTECTLQNLRKTIGASKPKSKDKDCE